MQPDYTKQLDALLEILRAETPWWKSPWILAGFSAALGVLGGFVGQQLQTVYQARKTRETLLKMGYGYAGQLLASLDVLLNSPQYVAHHKEAANIVLPAIPDDFVKSHRDVYTTLDESVVFDVIFQLGKKLAEPADNYDYVHGTMASVVLQFLMKRLTLDRMRKFRGDEEADTFAKILARYEPEVRATYLTASDAN